MADYGGLIGQLMVSGARGYEAGRAQDRQREREQLKYGTDVDVARLKRDALVRVAQSKADAEAAKIREDREFDASESALERASREKVAGMKASGATGKQQTADDKRTDNAIDTLSELEEKYGVGEQTVEEGGWFNGLIGGTERQTDMRDRIVEYGSKADLLRFDRANSILGEDMPVTEERPTGAYAAFMSKMTDEVAQPAPLKVDESTDEVVEDTGLIAETRRDRPVTVTQPDTDEAGSTILSPEKRRAARARRKKTKEIIEKFTTGKGYYEGGKSPKVSGTVARGLIEETGLPPETEKVLKANRDNITGKLAEALKSGDQDTIKKVIDEIISLSQE